MVQSASGRPYGEQHRLALLYRGGLRPSTRRPWAVRVWLWLFSLLLLLPFCCRSVELEAVKLRAAFLFQMTKFVTWPDTVLSPQQPLSACFVGEEAKPLADLFRQATQEKLSQGHQLATLYFDSWPALHQHQSTQLCHLVFSMQLGDGFVLAQKLAEYNTLFISAERRGLPAGAMFALTEDDNKITIVVNSQALERSHLKVQARFLRLARVWGGPSDDDV